MCGQKVITCRNGVSLRRVGSGYNSGRVSWSRWPQPIFFFFFLKRDLLELCFELSSLWLLGVLV